MGKRSIPSIPAGRGRGGASLASCHGYTLEATDGACGRVETPLFPPNSREPDFLLVRTEGVRPRFPIVSATLVERIDDARETVHVRASRAVISRLPENIPLVR